MKDLDKQFEKFISQYEISQYDGVVKGIARAAFKEAYKLAKESDEPVIYKLRNKETRLFYGGKNSYNRWSLKGQTYKRKSDLSNSINFLKWDHGKEFNPSLYEIVEFKQVELKSYDLETHSN